MLIVAEDNSIYAICSSKFVYPFHLNFLNLFLKSLVELRHSQFHLTYMTEVWCETTWFAR